MTINYDVSQVALVRKLLGITDLAIGLDVAEGKDKCLEVTYCIRHKDTILTVETLHIKEVNMPCGGKKTGGKRPPKK